jgi:putative cell wall-binding protein
VSSKIKGLRRVGIVGLSTLVAGSMMTLTAATSIALPPVYSALSAPNVTQGANNQSAGSLTLDFTNNFATNAAQTFTVAGNNCATAPGIAAATEFSAIPTAALTGPFLAGLTTAGTATKPAFTTTLGSSTTQCATAGIKDQVTLTLTTPSSVAGPTNWFKYTLSNVNYNVGAAPALGAISVATAGDLSAAPAAVTNATIVNKSFTFIPLIAAQFGSTGNVLGTAKFVETTAGAIFTPASSTTNVTLTLNDTGTFTAGVTPTITLPAGYTATVPVLSANTFTFTVNTPANLVKATVSVSGLKFNAGASTTPRVATLTAVAGGFTSSPMSAANVLNFTARTGGATRYETAAALFNGGGFLDDSGFVSDAVLSSGALFPDALSANYLAGRLGTGTLLTTPSTLSTAARSSMFAAHVKTVYITGGTGAVSQTVTNQIEAMHVANDPTKPFMSVVRLGGADRYATNKLVNENNFLASDTVLLASGSNFPDALAVGPVAYQGFPLILTRGVTLGATENSQLADFSPTNVIIAGGTGVVSAAIETSLKAQGFHVLRLAGADRTLTAAAVASWATVGITGATAGSIEEGLGFDSDTTYISTGNNFADALAAGPVAGDQGRTILLSSTSTLLGAGIPSYLGDLAVGGAADEVGVLHALGLTGAVSSALMKSAAATIGANL